MAAQETPKTSVVKKTALWAKQLEQHAIIGFGLCQSQQHLWTGANSSFGPKAPTYICRSSMWETAFLFEILVIESPLPHL